VAEEEAAGANNLEELAELERVLQKRIVSDWMSKGVRFLSPDTVRVESSVVLNPDSVISAGVHLLGKTEIGSGVSVGPFSVIEDSRVDENSRIESHCVLTGANLGKNVSIGPFARLRPGSDLADDVHIGNFVEIKKSILGTGVKAGHLTYLGDAEVGAHTNVGAGTITCNYDGFAKHKTIIEERVFIGSNTSLVAPVVVGTGAIVGAGSVIVENIEKDSLSFERSQQIHKPGGAKKFRSKYESGQN
jgi:bifunctional UDP-N-acetylglucosamine pyrophosphorylase/glucosamine-1-phosphate N-acetyltransferase